MRNLYKSWEPRIYEYLADNRMDAARVKNCGKAMGVINGRTTLILQEIGVRPSRGLLDETPAPVVLKVEDVNGVLVFTQTEHTKKFFS